MAYPRWHNHPVFEIMARLPISLRLLLLFFAATASTSPTISARKEKCAAEGLQSCASRGLSGAFCCEPGRTCVALAGNSTVMCCPDNSSCEAIRPITCDVGAQNPDANPRAPIKTLASKSKLPRCAKRGFCCPFGFTCADDGKLCVKDKDQSRPPEGYAAIPSPARTSVPVSTTRNTPSSSASASAPPPPPPPTEPSQAPSPESTGPEKTSIIVGAVGGVLALLLLAAIIFLCVRSSRKGDAGSDKPLPRSQLSGSGLHGNIISGPIMNPETSYRTDFIRKSSSARSSVSRSLASGFSRAPRLEHAPPPDARMSIPNPFNSPYPSGVSAAVSTYSGVSDHDDRIHRGEVGARLKPIRTLAPSSWLESRRISRRNLQRDTSSSSSSSSESISVFADANTVNGGDKGGQSHNRQTSFSAMMEEAKMGHVHRGQAYVPGGAKRHVPGTTPRI